MASFIKNYILKSIEILSETSQLKKQNHNNNCIGFEILVLTEFTIISLVCFSQSVRIPNKNHS